MLHNLIPNKIIQGTWKVFTSCKAHQCCVGMCMCVYLSPNQQNLKELTHIRLNLQFPSDQLRPDCLSIQPDGNSLYIFFNLYLFFVQSRGIFSPFPNHSPCFAHGNSQINCVNVSSHGLPGTGVWTDAFILNIIFYSCQECKDMQYENISVDQVHLFMHSWRKLKRWLFPTSHSANIHQCEPEALP